MAKKLIRLNKKSISFGAGPLRTNIGTRGVKSSLRVGGQTLQTKTAKLTSGKKATARPSSAVGTPPRGPVFESRQSKKFGYPGVALLVLGVLTMCGNFKVGAVLLVIGVVLITRGFNADIQIHKQEAADLATAELSDNIADEEDDVLVP